MTLNGINNQYGNYGSSDLSGDYQSGNGFNPNGGANDDSVSKYFQGYQGTGTDQYSNPGSLDRYLMESMGDSSGSSGYDSGYESGDDSLTTQQPKQYTYQQPKQPMNDATALARIQGVAGELDKESNGQTDGAIDVQDLKKALDDKSGKYTKDDKEAIQYLADNQGGLRGRLDSFDGKGDGAFKTDSVNKLVANPNAQPEKTPEQKMSNTDALMILNDTAKSHFKKGFHRDELVRMSKDPKASEEQRTAAKKLLDNEALFKAADTGRDNDDKYDGFISQQDMNKLINRSDVDKIGGSGSGGSSSGSGQPVVQSGIGSGSYPPVSTGNANMDYYYNNVYGTAIGPATDAYRSAPGGGQQAA